MAKFGSERHCFSAALSRMVKILLLPLLFAAATLRAEAPWKLVWSDEFNGAKLDYTKWAVEENGHGGGNGELQFYVDRPENVRVENGSLVIEARKEKFDLAGVRKD